METETRSKLVNSLKQGAICVLAGAGVSCALSPQFADVLCWDGFIEALARRVQTFRGATEERYQQWVNMDQLEAADGMEGAVSEFSSFTGTCTRYTGFVHPIVGPIRPVLLGHGKPPVAPLAEAIRSLSCPIMTTNFDMLLEECLGRTEVNLLVDQPNDPMDNYASRYVYHVHGLWNDWRGFVLSQNEYDQYRKDFLNVMQEFLCGRSLLFVGVGRGLTDPHMLELLQQTAAEHYWLVVENEVEQCEQVIIANNLINRVRVLSYGNDVHDLPGFLFELASESDYQRTRAAIWPNDEARCASVTFNNGNIGNLEPQARVQETVHQDERWVPIRVSVEHGNAHRSFSNNYVVDRCLLDDQQ